MTRAAPVRFAALLALGSLLSACTVPVSAGLDERDANLVADALDRAGMEASKEPDPGTEGRYRIVVPKGDAPAAIAVLREHDLPPRYAPGIADSVGKGSLVPSQLSEHAQYVAGLGGDIERTLCTVDGVLGARVHLSVPLPSPLSERPPDKSTASVLIKYAGATPPVSEAAVKGLVSGAVATIPPENVTVVMVGRPAAAALPTRQMTYVGPIAVTRASAIWLRGALAVTTLLLLVLVSAVAILWLRMRRLLAASATAAEGS